MAHGKETIDLVQWKPKECKLSVIKPREISSNYGSSYWQNALTGNKHIKETNVFERPVMPNLPTAFNSKKL